MKGQNRDDAKNQDQARQQTAERDAEIHGLRERLAEAEEEIDRLRRENEGLRRELKAAGRGAQHAKGSPKAQRKRPGRKAGQGTFTFRQAPGGSGASSEPPIEVPVTLSQCPCCGGELHYERTDEATVTDMPQAAQPEVNRYAVEVRRCEGCAAQQSHAPMCRCRLPRSEWGRVRAAPRQHPHAASLD